MKRIKVGADLILEAKDDIMILDYIKPNNQIQWIDDIPEEYVFLHTDQGVRVYRLDRTKRNARYQRERRERIANEGMTEVTYVVRNEDIKRLNKYVARLK